MSFDTAVLYKLLTGQISSKQGVPGMLIPGNGPQDVATGGE